MLKLHLFAKLHVSKFERKGCSKVTTISLKKHNFINSILLNKVTKTNYSLDSLGNVAIEAIIQGDFWVP